jgi:hypothetical protein
MKTRTFDDGVHLAVPGEPACDVTVTRIYRTAVAPNVGHSHVWRIDWVFPGVGFCHTERSTKQQAVSHAIATMRAILTELARIRGAS